MAHGTSRPTLRADANPRSSGKLLASVHIDCAEYPAYLAALIGAFADSSDVVVGTPFLVGDFATVKAPAGASELLLGIDDDILAITGALTVSASRPAAKVGAVPEPTGWVLMIAGFGMVGAALRWPRRITKRFA
jgi:hypothetical protein